MSTQRVMLATSQIVGAEVLTDPDESGLVDVMWGGTLTKARVLTLDEVLEIEKENEHEGR